MSPSSAVTVIGAAFAHHRIAVAGDEAPRIVELEMAVAGVAVATGGLHHEIALAVDRQIEGRVGGFDAALVQIAHHALVLHEADRLRYRFAIRRAARVVITSSNFTDFALERGRGDVREIVRDHVHRPVGRNLVRQRNEQRIVHGLQILSGPVPGKLGCSRCASGQSRGLLCFGSVARAAAAKSAG